jgi:hypothetical protein
MPQDPHATVVNLGTLETAYTVTSRPTCSLPPEDSGNKPKATHRTSFPTTIWRESAR